MLPEKAIHFVCSVVAGSCALAGVRPALAEELLPGLTVCMPKTVVASRWDCSTPPTESVGEGDLIQLLSARYRRYSATECGADALLFVGPLTSRMTYPYIVTARAIVPGADCREWPDGPPVVWTSRTALSASAHPLEPSAACRTSELRLTSAPVQSASEEAGEIAVATATIAQGGILTFGVRVLNRVSRARDLRIQLKALTLVDDPPRIDWCDARSGRIASAKIPMRAGEDRTFAPLQLAVGLAPAERYLFYTLVDPCIDNNGDGECDAIPVVWFAGAEVVTIESKAPASASEAIPGPLGPLAFPNLAPHLTGRRVRR